MPRTVPPKRGHKPTPAKPRSGGTMSFKVARLRGSFKLSVQDSSANAASNLFALRQQLGLTQEEFARVTAYSTRSIAGWETGTPPSDSARQKFKEVHRLATALGQLMPGEEGARHNGKEIGQWLRAANPAFENQTPLQIIERGETDRIWRMIWQIEAGVAS